ncbi:Ig-like domain-containing protein [Chitinophaga sp. 30R24]|uniref:Ig-like domain-containing protein n=1 Tax=Chitinophaga sp. 30R24 TaxID=3248838 RepID=UPI003B9109F1
MYRFFTLISILFCFFSAQAQFKGLVVNEFSQGSGGTGEYFEFVVVGTRTCTESTADLRGWIFDDQNGWYGGSGTGIAQGHMRFTTSNVWKDVPFGSIIVVYNKNDKNATISATLPDDPTDANGDNVYVIPIGTGNATVDALIEHNKSLPTSPSSPTYAYATTGYATISGTTPWETSLGLSNSGDAVIITNPNVSSSTPFFSIVFGFTPGAGFQTPTVLLGAVAASKCAYLNDDKYDVKASWQVASVPAGETPGKGNSVANQAWIDAMRTPVTASVLPIDGLTSVCVGSTITLSDATAGGTWSSNDNTIASIDPVSGVVTGKNPGTVTISYTTSGACSATATTMITVVAVPQITPAATVDICEGATTASISYTATGSPTKYSITWDAAAIAAGFTNVVNVALPASPTSVTVPAGAIVGSYTALITVSNSTCSGSANTTVVINPAPTVGPIGGPATVCKDASIILSTATVGGTWSSNADATATVNSSTGEVTGVAEGTATITYTLTNSCGTASQDYTVTVNDVPVISPIAGPTTVCKDATITLSDITIGGTWSSNADAIATVNSSTGEVTGVAEGTATITYTLTNSCGTASQDYTVTVNDVPVISPIAGPTTVCKDATITLSDITIGGTWSSNADAIATVNSSTGEVTGVAEGTATITYTLTNSCGTASQDYTVTVNDVPVVSSIAGPTAVCKDATITLSDVTIGGTWSSNADAIATVNSSTGEVTGVSAGTATIIYEISNDCGSTQVTRDITVNEVPVVADITGPDNVCVGSFITLANITPDGTWSSSDINIATVDVTTGKVTGVTTGSATISYTVSNDCGDVTKTYDITVGAEVVVAPIDGVSEVCKDAIIALNDATLGGVWSSSDNTIATVDGTTGEVTGVSVGTVTITYTVTNGCGSTSVSTTITVNDVPVVSPIGGASEVCKGATITLNDATLGGVWSSSDNTIATVDGTTGEVTGVSVGTVTITYTVTNGCGNTPVSTTITVNDVPVVSPIGGANAVCKDATITLNDATLGGVWSSSDNTIATVNGTTGEVTGVSVGTVTITYTVTNGCGNTSVSTTITVNDVPVVSPIGGANAVCKDATITLNDATLGGVWSSSDNTIATVNGTTGEVTGVSVGTVTITYTVTNGCGSTPVSATITVNDVPVVSPIGGANAVCKGATIALNDATLGGVWSSSDNTIATVDATTGEVAGVSVGTVTITYTVTNGCGNTPVSTTITVNDVPVVSPIGGASAVCKGATITLNDATVGGVWSSSDNTIATVNGTTGEVTGVSVGTVTITYTVTNGCGSTPVSTTITVNDVPVVSPIGGASAVCKGANITLNDATIGGVWSSSDNTIATVNGTTGEVTGVSVGTVTITYTVTNGCGSTPVSTTITVNDVPVVSPIGGANAVCKGATITLNDATIGGVWSSSDNTIATVNSSTGVVMGVATGTVTITYTVTNGCGSAFRTTLVTVNDLPVVGNITGNNALCKNTTTPLSNATAGGVWSSSNTAIAIVDASTGLVTGVAAGSATIIYTVTNSCGDAFVSHLITVNDIPVIAPITGASVICKNASTSLSNATAGGVWSSSNPAIATVDATGVVTGNAKGSVVITYTVTTSGCTNTAQVTVNVDDFNVKLTSTEPLIAGKPINLQTSSDEAYTVSSWQPGALFPNQTAKEQTFTPIQATNIIVRVEAMSAAGCEATAMLSLNILPNNNDFYIPNAFTPNGDGKNDVFKAYGSAIQSVELKVFSQWGEVMYEGSGNSVRGWDGTYKGRQQPVGVYVYTVRAIMADGTVVNQKGSVNLIR